MKWLTVAWELTAIEKQARQFTRRKIFHHNTPTRTTQSQTPTNAADVEKVVPEVLSAQSISPLRTCSTHASFIAVGGTTQRNSHKQDPKWMPSQAH
jgi:hypothetical protein